MNHHAIHTLVVGTSPIALLYALDRARAGLRVLVVDRGAVGGCWREAEQFGADAACHLLEPNPVGYDRLRAEGVPLRVADPQPVEVLGSLTFPLGSIRAEVAKFLLYLAVIVRNAVRVVVTPWRTGRFAAFASHVRELPRRLARLGRAFTRRPPVLEVDGGVHQLLGALTTQATEHGVVFERGDVDLDVDREGRVTARLDGASLAVEQVVVTDGYDGGLGIDGQAVALAGRSVAHRHVLVTVPAADVRPFTYVSFVANPVLVRATRGFRADVGEGEEPVDLLLVQLRADGERPELDVVVSELVAARVLAPGCRATQEPLWIEGVSHDRHHDLARLAVPGSGLTVLRSFGDLTARIGDLVAGDP